MKNILGFSSIPLGITPHLVRFMITFPPPLAALVDLVGLVVKKT